MLLCSYKDTKLHVEREKGVNLVMCTYGKETDGSKPCNVFFPCDV